jgi:phage shock protein A
MITVYPPGSKIDTPEIKDIRNRILQLHDEKKRLHARLEANEADLKKWNDELSKAMGFTETPS